MIKLNAQLLLKKCPHCSIANPNLSMKHHFETTNHHNANKRMWVVYACGNCGGVVTASGISFGHNTLEIFPSSITINEDIPERAKAYLEQAVASIHAPAGAIMLVASSVDAMLKDKEYLTGSLYSRIEQAVQDNLLTSEMATWAHEVRLDANDQRHADEDTELPNENDAQKGIDFAIAIAEYLFVLPAKVERGLSS